MKIIFERIIYSLNKVSFKIKSYLKLFFLFISLLITFISFCQTSGNAHSNIVLLKNGALFIKLKTSENAIIGLIQRGRKEEAEKIKTEQEIENKEIIAAFKNNFTFCKVYFFYSNNSQKIKEGNYKDCLLNTFIEIDSSFTGNDYLIGEFGKSETTKIDGFIIEDKNFIQLKSPFPFLIRLNEDGVFTRSESEIAYELNNKLTSFWNENAAKK